MSDLIVGIDLGTSNSLVAFCDARGPRIIASPEGRSILPSVVALDAARKELLVGDAAAAGALARPETTVHSIKRLMGRGLSDLRQELPHLPYHVVAHAPAAGEAETVDVQLAGRRFTPQQLSAMILAELRRWAEAHFRKPVQRAVITVPAYFDDAQRQATRDAGEIAGLEVVRVVNEPTAAALAYGFDRLDGATVAVYDLGGGTFDISILRVEQGVFRVLATSGDTHLGGDDFDRLLVELFQREIRSAFGAGVDFDSAALQALRTFAQDVKVRLSEAPSASLEVDAGGGRVYRRTVTRAEYEALISPLVERTLACCRTAVLAAGEEVCVEKVILAGGATYTPLVRARVQEFFSAELFIALNPMEVVALGAAVQASILAGSKRDALLLDVTPLSLGIETMGGAVSHLIPRGTSVPCHAASLFTTSVDGQTSIKVHVVQGERQMVKDCRSLGTLIVSDIPPMPAGVPKLEVSFLVDTSGILSVSGRELRSGAAAELQIIPSHGLSRGEVAKMIRDGAHHLHEDLVQHWLTDLRQQATMDTAAVEKAIERVGGQLEAGYRQELLDIVQGLREMLSWNDPEALQRALMYLNRKAARVSELAIAQSLREVK
jgi:molecular chaperone DnaK (HSP70)